tara:strand:+ start:147 stop:452 length:306 start_codon:yes stop_codon:yes gene_type:complete
MLFLCGIITWIVLGIYIYVISLLNGGEFPQSPFESFFSFVTSIPVPFLAWGGFGFFWQGFGGKIGNEDGGWIPDRKLSKTAIVIIVVVAILSIMLVVSQAP